MIRAWKCPVCGSPVYEGQKNFYCSDRSCRFTLWKENRFLDRLRTRLDEDKVKDLLACGRTTVKDLYSIKKAIIAVAFVISMVLYVAYYRMEEMRAFYIAMVPLVTEALSMGILVCLARL